jgi:hypothetical protein
LQTKGQKRAVHDGRCGSPETAWTTDDEEGGTDPDQQQTAEVRPDGQSRTESARNGPAADAAAGPRQERPGVDGCREETDGSGEPRHEGSPGVARLTPRAESVTNAEDRGRYQDTGGQRESDQGEDATRLEHARRFVSGYMNRPERRRGGRTTWQPTTVAGHDDAHLCTGFTDRTTTFTLSC